MKVREEGKTAIKFPVGKYFRQIFSNSAYVTIINPFKFWRKYRVERLESCYEYSLTLLLERCQKKECLPSKFDRENDSVWWEKCRTLPFEQQNRNAIIISQPNYELKYRGVGYCANSIYISNQTGIDLKDNYQSSTQPKISLESSGRDRPQTSNSI